MKGRRREDLIRRARRGLVASAPELEAEKRFLHVQRNASSVWIIEHNLGNAPFVTCYDDDGQWILAQVNYPSENRVEVTHGRSLTGIARLMI